MIEKLVIFTMVSFYELEKMELIVHDLKMTIFQANFQYFGQNDRKIGHFYNS